MRTIFKTGAVALLDNDEAAAAAAAAGGAEGEPADNANSLETDLTEVADSEGEGDQNEAALDEAVDTKEALEQYMAALEGYIGEGGIDSKGAHLMSIGVNFMSNRQGFRAEERTNIATEHFAGPSSKLKANQHALESLGEQVKKIWESIKAAIKRAIDWLKDHFNKIFGAAEKLEKRAKAISEKAKGVTGTAKESKFDNDRLVKALNISGTVPSGLSAKLDVVAKGAEDVFGAVATFGATSGQVILDAMSSEGTIDTVENGTFANVAFLKPMSAGDAKSAGFEAPGDGLTLFRSEELPGGKALLGRYPVKKVKGLAAIEMYSKTSSTLTAFNNKAPDVTNASLPTLPAAEMGKIADAVQALARSVISFRQKADKANEMKSKILAAADKVSKAEIKEDDKAKKDWMTGMQKLASASVNVIDKPAPQLSQYILVTGKAALDYCEESLKQYGGK